MSLLRLSLDGGNTEISSLRYNGADNQEGLNKDCHKSQLD